MVLFSLVLALGMLVDNGIVIVENIYRFMDEGYTAKEAVIQGVGEVAWPIISSTATTVAAFIPLALWPGIIGEFMKFLPLTLMIVLTSSLFVALVINPVLAVSYMKIKQEKPVKQIVFKTFLILSVIGIFFVIFGFLSFGNLLIFFGLMSLLNYYVLYPGTMRFQEKFLPWLDRIYGQFLTFVMTGKRPLKFILGTIGLLFFSIFLMVIFPPKVEFFPENDPNYVNIFISHPIGTDIKITNETTIKVEKDINKILEKYSNKDTEAGIPKNEQIIKSIISQVGEGTSDPAQGVAMGNTPNKARITVNFNEFQFRGHMIDPSFDKTFWRERYRT
jgi:multidrug efflux pump subunit AcrB